MRERGSEEKREGETHRERERERERNWSFTFVCRMKLISGKNRMNMKI